jgi:hypothetical protein
MKVVTVGNIPEALIQEAGKKLGKDLIPVKFSGFFQASGPEGLVIGDSERMREVFLASKGFRRVFVYTYPHLGGAMEVVGALREMGREAAILFHGEPSVEREGFSIFMERRRVRVRVLPPERPSLLTWAISDGPFFSVSYGNQGEAEFICSSCSDFPTYDARICVLGSIMGGFPVEVTEVSDDIVRLKIPCGKRMDGELSIVRPNRWFCRFDVIGGKVEGEVLFSHGAEALLREPTGRTFLMLEGNEEDVKRKIGSYFRAPALA